MTSLMMRMMMMTGSTIVHLLHPRAPPLAPPLASVMSLESAPPANHNAEQPRQQVLRRLWRRARQKSKERKLEKQHNKKRHAWRVAPRCPSRSRCVIFTFIWSLCSSKAFLMTFLPLFFLPPSLTHFPPPPPHAHKHTHTHTFSLWLFPCLSFPYLTPSFFSSLPFFFSAGIRPLRFWQRASSQAHTQCPWKEAEPGRGCGKNGKGSGG